MCMLYMTSFSHISSVEGTVPRDDGWWLFTCGCFGTWLEIKTLLFEWVLIVVTIFCCLDVKNISNKVFVCFYKITYYVIVKGSNPLLEACSGFLIAACDSINCFRKSDVILKIVPKAGNECALEKIVQWEP